MDNDMVVGIAAPLLFSHFVASSSSSSSSVVVVPLPSAPVLNYRIRDYDSFERVRFQRGQSAALVEHTSTLRLLQQLYGCTRTNVEHIFFSINNSK